LAQSPNSRKDAAIAAMPTTSTTRDVVLELACLTSHAPPSSRVQFWPRPLRLNIS
jgi:hypothetical protein